MASKRQTAYALEVNSIIGEYNTVSLAYTQRVKALLFEAERRIASRIIDISSQDWEGMVLTDIQNDIRNILEEFRTDYDATMLASLRSASEYGVNVVKDPITDNLDFSLTFGAPEVFQSAVVDEHIRAFWNLSSSLIKNVTDTVSQKIMDEITLGMIMGESRSNVINSIIGELGGEAFGVKNLNARAWAIYRTETAKMYSFANERQMRATLQYIPDAKKQWHHGVLSGLGQKARPGHVALDGEVIPMNERFVNTNTGAILRFPHDPEAPASEVINCGCIHTLALPEDSVLRDKSIINI